MSIIDSGKMIRKIGREKVEDSYTMRLLIANEVEMAMELQEYVYENLANKDILFCDEYEDVVKDVLDRGKIIGVFNKVGEIVAYRYISIPGSTDKNLGRDLGIVESELIKVAHLETTVVHPDYRGNGLQSLTLEKSLPIINAMGFKHLLCTVSPQNIYSLYNILKNGLTIKSLKRKYGTTADNGVWRFILHRDLEEVPVIDFSEPRALRIDSFEEQKELISSGYVGNRLCKEKKMIDYVLNI